mgnify:FL=1
MGQFFFMYKKGIKYLDNQIQKTDSLKECLKKICYYLNKNFVGYDWVGFYFHDKINKELNLIAFSGIPTDHTKIPFGKGICGQSALSNDPIIVDDVSKETNYISCNLNVKSEIVVPIFEKGNNIGQIDIDSNNLNQFTSKDLEFLKKINLLISKKFFEK